MDYFEAKQHLERLRQFRDQLSVYFEAEKKAHKGNDFLGKPIIEQTDEFKRISSEINVNVPKIQFALHMVGQATEIYYSPPPAVGGMAGNVPVFTNLERRIDFGLTPRSYYDILDQGIGRYEYFLPSLKRKLFNPFYWIFERGLFALVRYIINMLGFTFSPSENPTADRIMKTIVFITAVLGFIKIILELTKEIK